jgi:hydroxymethylpyrimidine/phosphomethylpyrimidine kinase
VGKRLFYVLQQGSAQTVKRILTIAGSDSGGGAGIQADLKTIAVLGSYGMSVITALTAQNTLGVQGVHPVPADVVALQMVSVLSDIGADAAKTGMLVTAETVWAVAQHLKQYEVKLVVVDPVMVSESGRALLENGALAAITEALLPVAHVVTPNLSEASAFCGFPVEDVEAMKRAARHIHRLGPRWVLVKGGHLKGDAMDVLFDGHDFQVFGTKRLDTPNTHGTGCTFSAALTHFLGQGLPTSRAVKEAKGFITRAIAMGLTLGAGRGPTNPYAHVLHLLKREGDVRAGVHTGA